MANKNYETNEEFVKYLEDLQEKTEKALSSMEKLLTLTSQVVLEKKNILNGEEKEIYKCFISTQTKYNGILDTTKYQISSQVVMSAFVDNTKNKDKELAIQCWYLYNKLYVDFLIVEQKEKEPVCVIEYNGKGHNSYPNALANDKIKRTICEQIGIPFIVLESIEGKEIQEIKDYIKKEIIAKGLSKILKQ